MASFWGKTGTGVVRASRGYEPIYHRLKKTNELMLNDYAEFSVCGAVLLPPYWETPKPPAVLCKNCSGKVDQAITEYVPTPPTTPDHFTPEQEALIAAGRSIDSVLQRPEPVGKCPSCGKQVPEGVPHK